MDNMEQYRYTQQMNHEIGYETLMIAHSSVKKSNIKNLKIT